MEILVNGVNKFILIIISMIVSFFCTSWIYPYILKVAKTKGIVDNPDARKLQRVPIPVMGGMVVVFGIITGLMVLKLFCGLDDMFPIITSIMVILIVGLIDDMISMSPRSRFVVEIALVLFLIYTTGHQLNNFHGLWGVYSVPDYVSVPLTVVACVGIINAINLIDGVDGYSSGYSIVSCILFGAMFYKLGNEGMVAMAAVVTISLVPFFMHNVFGKLSKMFIGDAGTLSLGIVFSVFVINILSTKAVDESSNLGLVAFAMAVLCVPIFDTVRVMVSRIVRRKSPFHPDKTHLHHLFIELGFSHIGTTMSIITMNLLVVLCWFCAYKCGLSVDLQFYIVIALGILITFVFYAFIKAQIRKETALCRVLRSIGAKTHFKRTGLWLFLQKMSDKVSREESIE